MDEIKDKKLTTWEVLRFKFPESEYVLLTEVSDASGFARSRSLDFMIINLWQSRGLSVTGIERKSNRGDWLKELKNPAKQENHFKHCDYFYLLTDREGVAKLEEIPEGWGWYYINDKQILKTMKPAQKLKSIPIDRSLLCAMLRRAACKTNYVHRDTLQSEIQTQAEKIKTQKNYTLERDAEAYKDLKAQVETFENASGISIRSRWDSKNIGETVRVLMSIDLPQYVANLERMKHNIKNMHDGLEKNIEIIKEQNNV